MSLFDLRPKTSRDELFDREMELEELHRSVGRGYPLIAVLGIRRIGKTSVLKTFLGEIKGIYIDLRGIRSTTDLEERVSDALSSSFSRLRRLVEGIRYEISLAKELRCLKRCLRIFACAHEVARPYKLPGGH